MKNKIRYYMRLFTALGIICLVLAGLCPKAVKAGNTIKINVGCLESENFVKKNPDGSVSGFLVDYLNELSKYENFEYNYIFGQWEELENLLNKGEIDIIYTNQNRGDGLLVFSEEPFSYNLTAIYVREDADFFYNDFHKLSGARVGYLKNSYYDIYFDEYARVKNFKYKPCEYETLQEMKAALLKGEIDCMATTSDSYEKDIKCVGNFGVESIYFAARPANLNLIKQLDYAMGNLLYVNNEFDDELFKKYFHNALVDSIMYTRQETEFIKNCPVLNVALSDDIMPMSYKDSNTGEIKGIIYEILELISKKSGLKFNYVLLNSDNLDYNDELLKENKVDLVGSGYIKHLNINKSLATNSYLTINQVLVGVKGRNISLDTKKEYKIAIVSGETACFHLIDERIPTYNIVAYDTVEKCLNAVKSGKADLFWYNQYSLEEYLSRPVYENLTIIPKMESEEPLVITAVDYTGGQKQQKQNILKNPLLISVLNKAIENIDENEINAIVIKNTVHTKTQLTPMDYLYKYRYASAGILFLLIIIIVLILQYGIMQRQSIVQMEIKNKQLQDAISQANDANKTKSMFLAQMSHELRTPMNSVIGMTDLAKKSLDNKEKTAQYLEKIELSSNMLLSIINDILDMSAIENNKLKIAKEPFNIKDIIYSIKNVYYMQCKEKGIKLNVIINDMNNEMLIGDSLRVNQILLNLVSNAYKFTEKNGKINIIVSEKKMHNDRVHIEFIVEDNGCGMSMDMQERLFHIFEQESTNTARKYGGSGLGLAITKNLVEMMHGVIEVESQEGIGTRFIVNIPFKVLKADKMENETKNMAQKQDNDDIISKDKTDNATDSKSIQDDSTDNENNDNLLNNTINMDNAITNQTNTEKKYDFHGKRILLAEDFELNRDVATDILAEVNIEVDCATDGLEAVEMFTKSMDGTYEIILMDIQMPNMNGLDAAKKIRKSKHKQAKTIPIFAMTANAYAEDVSASIAAGMNEHIAKPINTDLLYELLYKYIQE